MNDGMDKKRIDEHEYSFGKIGAKRSLRILTKLAKIAGEPIALAMTSATGEGKLLDRKLDPDLISKAVRSLMDKLDEDIVIDLIEELAVENVLCDGKKIVFDLHYQGKLPHLFKVVAAALEVQYGNFFDVLKGLPGLRTNPTIQGPTT